MKRLILLSWVLAFIAFPLYARTITVDANHPDPSAAKYGPTGYTGNNLNSDGVPQRPDDSAVSPALQAKIDAQVKAQQDEQLIEAHRKVGDVNFRLPDDSSGLNMTQSQINNTMDFKPMEFKKFGDK